MLRNSKNFHHEDAKKKTQLRALCVPRDGVCNPVTHVLKAIEVFKRFGRGCKPRPASSKTFWFTRATSRPIVKKKDFVGAGHARDITTMISGVIGIARGHDPLLQSLTALRGNLSIPLCGLLLFRK
jgi:hypothetical protein